MPSTKLANQATLKPNVVAKLPDNLPGITVATLPQPHPPPVGGGRGAALDDGRVAVGVAAAVVAVLGGCGVGGGPDFAAVAGRRPSVFLLCLVLAGLREHSWKGHCKTRSNWARTSCEQVVRISQKFMDLSTE